MSAVTPTIPRERSVEAPAAVASARVSFLAYGGLQILAGVLAMSSPFIATLLTVTFLGFLFLVGGVVQILSAITAHGRGFWANLIGGIFYTIAGFFVVQHPLATGAGLTLLLAVAFFFGGVLRIVMALVDRFPGWGYVLTNGVITLVLGIMLWRQWPEDSLWVIGLFLGIDLFVSGCTWAMLALATPSMTKHAVATAAFREHP